MYILQMMERFCLSSHQFFSPMTSEPEHDVPPRPALREHPNNVSQSSFKKGSESGEFWLGLMRARKAPSPGISAFRRANPSVPANEGMLRGTETGPYVIQASLAIHCLSVMFFWTTSSNKACQRDKKQRCIMDQGVCI